MHVCLTLLVCWVTGGELDTRVLVPSTNVNTKPLAIEHIIGTREHGILVEKWLI